MSPRDWSIPWFLAASQLSWLHCGGQEGSPDPITAGSPGHTWQSCLSSAPWPASVGDKDELSGLPTCPPIPHNPPGEMGAPPEPLASPSLLTKMLSRIIFQGKRLLRMKQERGQLVTACHVLVVPITQGQPKAGTCVNALDTPAIPTHPTLRVLETHRGPWQQASTR